MIIFSFLAFVHATKNICFHNDRREGECPPQFDVKIKVDSISNHEIQDPQGSFNIYVATNSTMYPILKGTNIKELTIAGNSLNDFVKIDIQSVIQKAEFRSLTLLEANNSFIGQLTAKNANISGSIITTSFNSDFSSLSHSGNTLFEQSVQCTLDVSTNIAKLLLNQSQYIFLDYENHNYEMAIGKLTKISLFLHPKQELTEAFHVGLVEQCKTLGVLPTISFDLPQVLEDCIVFFDNYADVPQHDQKLSITGNVKVYSNLEGQRLPEYVVEKEVTRQNGYYCLISTDSQYQCKSSEMKLVTNNRFYQFAEFCFHQAADGIAHINILSTLQNNQVSSASINNKSVSFESNMTMIPKITISDNATCRHFSINNINLLMPNDKFILCDDLQAKGCQGSGAFLVMKSVILDESLELFNSVDASHVEQFSVLGSFDKIQIGKDNVIIDSTKGIYTTKLSHDCKLSVITRSQSIIISPTASVTENEICKFTLSLPSMTTIYILSEWEKFGNFMQPIKLECEQNLSFYCDYEKCPSTLFNYNMSNSKISVKNPGEFCLYPASSSDDCRKTTGKPMPSDSLAPDFALGFNKIIIYAVESSAISCPVLNSSSLNHLHSLTIGASSFLKINAGEKLNISEVILKDAYLIINGLLTCNNLQLEGESFVNGDLIPSLVKLCPQSIDGIEKILNLSIPVEVSNFESVGFSENDFKVDGHKLKSQLTTLVIMGKRVTFSLTTAVKQFPAVSVRGDSFILFDISCFGDNVNKTTGKLIVDVCPATPPYRLVLSGNSTAPPSFAQLPPPSNSTIYQFNWIVPSPHPSQSPLPQSNNLLYGIIVVACIICIAVGVLIYMKMKKHQFKIPGTPSGPKDHDEEEDKQLVPIL